MVNHGNGYRESEKKIMNLKNKLWYFWGCMDVPAVMLYCVNTIRQDRIPFISDIVAFSGLSSDVASGGYSALVLLFYFGFASLTFAICFGFGFSLKKNICD